MDKKNIGFILGCNGQDGSYLIELLLEKGYEVHGVIRRSSVFNTERIDHLMDHPQLTLHYGDVTDPLVVSRLVAEIQPTEVYNLAAQSHVAVSFEIPNYTAQVDAVGTMNVLEAVRAHAPEARFYQASTSELYGGMEYNKNEKGLYDEDSPFHPRSPYGVAKIYGFWAIKNYREAYNMHASNGILFNHEGPRRGKTFVTRKITQALCNIYLGNQDVLKLGNLYARRDWGHAKKYVEGMWLMLQQPEPDDYVLATGESYSVKDFCERAGKLLGMDIYWEGEGLDEVGIDRNTRKVVIEVDEKYFRPSDVDYLIGDPSKAQKELGWDNSNSFQDLVEDMVFSDFVELGGNDAELRLIKLNRPQEIKFKKFRTLDLSSKSNKAQDLAQKGQEFLDSKNKSK